ncbi:Putative nuclease [Frankliniella fusca]|uniref:Nuclease n=1 Tax=Frankliniella fusca TaxID=407009 RepID=A0AAE1H9V3_9NEOP|nr:Putative nuclease [Frankliniella fusca]
MSPFIKALNIKLVGLTLPWVIEGGAPLRLAASAYVDDATAILDNANEVETLSTVLEAYGVEPGLRVNPAKSKVLPLGSWSRTTPCPYPYVDEVRILGVTFTRTVRGMMAANWPARMRALRGTLVDARLRVLNICQRVRYCNTYALSILWHTAQVLPLPAGILKDAKMALSAMLWAGEPLRVAFDVLCLPPASPVPYFHLKPGNGTARRNAEDENFNIRDHYREPRNRICPILVDVNGFRLLEDPTFSEHFRMNRTTFERLLVAVGEHLEQMGRMVQPRTPLDLKLMMSLWIMATQDTFRSVAVKFSVPSRGTVHYHYVTIIQALREMAPKYISGRICLKGTISRLTLRGGVVRCIDCSHMYITAPLIQPQRYVNRFQKYSVHLQAVCDHRRVFRDIYIGQPGSVNDSKVLQWSPLGHSLLHDNDMFSEGEHILGDGAYVLTDKIITPYRNNGNLDERRGRHNLHHSKARATIERAFGHEKEKFQRPKLFRAFNHQYVIDTIVSSCVLHNFILLEGQAYINNGQHQPLAAQVDPQNDYPDGAMARHDDVGPGNVHENVDDPDNGDENEENVDDPNNVNDNAGNAEVIIPEVDPLLGPAMRAGQLKRDCISFLLHPPINED